MAQVGVKIFEISGYTGYFILIWKKAATPLVEEGRSDALPFPVASQTILAPNLSSESYIFEFWQSSDGASLNTKIGADWPIDASAYSGSIASRWYYIVNGGRTNVTENTGSEVWADPVQDDTQISDERLAGASKDDVEVSMRGVGIRRPDEWDLLPGGGIQLLVGGEVFNDLDTIFVTYYQKVSTQTTSSATNDYSDVISITADAIIDDTFKNKVVYCNSSIAVTTLTFPAFNTMADQKIKFVTNGMTGNYLTLVFTTAVYFAGANRTEIHLASGRLFEVLIKNGVAYIVSEISQSGYDVRGKRDFSDDIKPHQLLRDGTIRDPADYPGIVEWIKTLPASSVISVYATWNTDDNKHKYYLNESNGQFALPDDRNMHHRALSAFDGSVIIGRYEADQNKLHTHKIDIPSRDFKNNGSTGPDLTGSDGGASGGSKRTFTTSSDGGSENTVKNVGLLAVINL